MERTHFVAYCGLYCNLCDHRTRIPEQAAALRESMRKADYEDFGPGIAGFDEFWRFLGDLTQPGDDKRCRTGKCGSPFCAIRKCAQEKGVDLCPYCDQYPCQHIETLAGLEPTLIQDGRRMQDIGLDAWIEEQGQRGKAGYCYGDTRCPGGRVPEVPRE